jgi:hypothetical protein
MSDTQIIERCQQKLGMSLADAQWVASNLYTYEFPNWSEMTWHQIDRMFRSVIFKK